MSKLRRFFEWIGFAQTFSAILQAEFARTLLFPMMVTLATGAVGVLGGIPLMWIIMAASLAFAGTTHGLLRASEYLERKNPLNKLICIGVHFSRDLLPVTLPNSIIDGNRQQRRAGGSQQNMESEILSPTEIRTDVPRQLDKGQVSVELRNTASFPISCILYSADTEVAGIKPPRATFPKPATTVQPGSVFRINDDRMDMNGLPCSRFSGKMDMVIKYGLPGKEKFELRLVGDLDIVMEKYGLVNQVITSWRN